MNRIFAAASIIPKTCIRRLSVTKVRSSDALARIKQKQKHFQTDDDVPVYLKGGPMDKVLLYITVILTVGSAGGGVYTAYNKAIKK